MLALIEMTSAISWDCGLRIVDLSEVAKQMQCKECSSLLDLKSTQSEDRIGLASILFISCQCGVLNDVHTSGYVKTEMGTVVYTLNTQLTSSKKTRGHSFPTVPYLNIAYRV